MATDILTTTVAAPAPFPRGLPISDLDLRDDRYPLISPRHVPPAIHQGTSSPNVAPSHTPFYPNAVHQPVRGPSLPSSDSASYDLKSPNTPSLRLTSTHPDISRVSSDRRSMLHPSLQSSSRDAASPNSFPLDHAQPTKPPPTMNDINNLQFFGPSQISQASSGEASKAPPTADISLPNPHPRVLQPSSPWHTSPQDSHPTERHTPSPRSGAALNQTQGVQIPSSPLQGMRMSSAAQYNPTVGIPVSVSSSPRVQAQQPTYINPTPAPNPINPVLTSQPLPPEEVCVECAMRDQDMVDVDVSSPGVWARESDVHYEDLLRRELEEAIGVSPQEQQRLRARGGRLTEANLKLWHSLNPKEPASKAEALERYVKMQQSLVEAEALAHARAVLESRQIEDRMRDAYSQLRRSAYELGTAASPDDRGGVRIKTLRSSMLPLPAHAIGHSREVTVLENGMIVEHVDVRREERDERYQRRREDKRSRARKSSRGSAFDVASMYSNMSPSPHTDSGVPLLPSRSSTSRPMSVATSPIDTFTRGMQSNASIEALSMVSAGVSPNRRTRFFGVRNLSPSFRSSDSLIAPSGFSGSMVDMHVALQQSGGERLAHSPVELNDSYQTIDNWRASSAFVPRRGVEHKPEEKPKKRKGLAKIWHLVTRASKHNSSAPPDMTHTRSLDRVHDDDYPLTPPPPLSYLVSRSRGTGDNGGPAVRHVSMPSLTSSASPNYPLSSAGMSPPTAPSSLLPSPTSSRPVVTTELSDSRKVPVADSDGEQQQSPFPEEDRSQLSPIQRGVHPTTSEPDLRHRASQVLSSPAPPVPRVPPSVTHTSRPPSSAVWRDKVLPPLPGEVTPRTPTLTQGESRPRTLFSYDMREVGGEQMLTAPQAPFAHTEKRRQSFNGLSNSPLGLVTQTLPARRTGFDPEKYGVMGGSRSALVSASPQIQQPTKRKSKFGLGLLLGRKTPVPVQDSGPVEFPLGRSSGSEARDEAELGMHYAEAEQGQPFPRLSMSFATRRNIESLVDQSPDFVSYRYPSGHQGLHLLR